MPSLNRSQLAASESLDYDGLVRTVAETVFNDDDEGYVDVRSSSDSGSPPWSRFIPAYPSRRASPPIYCDDDASSSENSDTDDDEVVDRIIATPPDSFATSRGYIARASDVESDVLPTRLGIDLTKSAMHRNPSQAMPRKCTAATPTPRRVNRVSRGAKNKASCITKQVAASPRHANPSLLLPTPFVSTSPASNSFSPVSRKRRSPDEPLHAASGHERETKRQAISSEVESTSRPSQSQLQGPRRSRLNVTSFTPESSTSPSSSSSKLPVIHFKRENVQRALHEILDSDEDANSYDDPRDQDYTPFDHPPTNPHRHQNKHRATTHATPPWIPQTALHQKDKKSTRHGPPQTTSRLKPAALASTFESAVDSQAALALNGECKECGWKQARFRLPDFKRHLRSHCRKANEDQGYAFKCTGIPYKYAEEYQVPPTVELREGDGGTSDLRVAACMMTFSRRDALRRHVLSSRTCLPDPSIFPKIRRMYGGEWRDVSLRKPRAVSKKAEIEP